MKKALYWFTYDLRLQDNPALRSLLQGCDQLAFVYVVDPQSFHPSNYHHKAMGVHRWHFIADSLRDLDQQLQQQGHRLFVLEGGTTELARFITNNDIARVGCAKQIGWSEQQRWQQLNNALPDIEFVSQWNSVLFEPDQLRLSETSLASFTQFRKHLESQHIQPILPATARLAGLPPPLVASTARHIAIDALGDKYAEPPAPLDAAQVSANQQASYTFSAGEGAAHAHIDSYFSSPAPLSYKLTRNALDGWQQSTKFSPYLASGNVSPRQLWRRLKDYEAEHGSNESTYWIGFELWWREYFQWLALQQKHRLFALRGSNDTAPLTSFFPERFVKWCRGTTPYPLVNACMHQLNACGFMSNRGRQLVASCLVNELLIDWRFGAAYFQQQLIDYDVASNWCNWQYIAGVGADPRGGRHFNLEKQTQLYDPDGVFIDKWQGQQTAAPLDSVDAADWPIAFSQPGSQA